MAEEVVDIIIPRFGGSGYRRCLTAETKPARGGDPYLGKDLASQVEYAVSEEMANSLCDLMVRRLQLFYTPSAGLDKTEECARLMESCLNWQYSKVEAEVALYRG